MNAPKTPNKQGGRKREFGFDDQVLTGSIDRSIENHDVEGYEHNEIAEMLGCSIGTSKSQFQKARTNLRKVLNVTPAENNPRYAPQTPKIQSEMAVRIRRGASALSGAA